MRIHPEKKTITFSEYPFKAQAFESGMRLHKRDILEVLPDRSPPECVTTQHEVLFVDAQDRDLLREWAEAQKLPLSQRPDLWSWINEPFLDTVFSQEIQEKTMEYLAKNGIDGPEVEGIRQKVQAHMLMYNAILWDWTHLGHYDVLLSRKKYSLQRLTPSFYHWTMGIALRNLK